MKKISRKGFLKVAAAAAMSGVTASALAACNAGSSSSTAASTGEAIYTPGTYTGTATGIGEVKVTMTFSETAITDVVIDASNETESIGGVAAPTLKDALMAAQSTEIDNISGATITTNAVKKAAASCIEQAMGVHTAGGDTAASSSDEDWLGTEPEIDESKVAKTVDVDVAVVGCGIAGVAACRSVAEDGGLVAAFEKADGPQCRSGEYAVINGKVQAKWGRDTWTREQIDDIIDSHMVESTYRCKRSIMSKWAHNIGDAFDWWVEANPDLYYAETTRSAIPDESANNFIIPIFYPLPEHYDWKQERFPCYPTSVEFKPDQHVTVEANMQKAIDTGNVQTFYGCFVEKLIMENGRCVGLYARDAATGEYIKCNASKGVILATGDYMNNEAMVKRWCPDVDGFDKKQYQKTGDGHIMAIDAGAKMENLGHTKMMHDFDSGLMYEEPFLYVNMEGKRFCNEDTGFVYMGNITKYLPRYNGANVDANHPDGSLGWYCQIYDSDYMSYANSPVPEQVMTKYIPGAVENPQGVFTNLIDTYKADTIEELAALLDVPADELQKTIDRYNELCDQGTDADFGKKSAYMHKIEKAPFWGVRKHIRVSSIDSGVNTNANGQALDADGKVIEGLYCVGNVGGVFYGGADYPFHQTGLSLGRCYTFGMLAAKHAMGK